MLYHASPMPGLRQLLPAKSTHGIPYVYAVEHRILALLFGAPKDDFDLLIDLENGKPVIYEVYTEALTRIYQEKACSLYILPADGFRSGQTGWEPEWVCPHSVPVLREEVIPDILVEIQKAIQQNECILYRYSEDAQYRAFLQDEIRE